MKMRLGWIAALVAAGWGSCAFAAVLVSTPAPQSGTEGYLTDQAPMQRVQVGSSDVPITGLGVYGQFTAASNAKFAIFLANFSNSSTGATRVLVTNAVAESSGAAAWADSPSFDYTLLANQVYYLGMITNNNVFTYEFDTLANSAARSGSGLTITKDTGGGNFGNMQSYANPTHSTTLADGSAQFSLRISGVPEPTAMSLMGLAVIGAARRRRR